MPALAVIAGLSAMYVVDKTLDHPKVKVWIVKNTRWITKHTDEWKAENDAVAKFTKEWRAERAKEKAKEVINGGDPTSSSSPDGGTA